MSTWQFYADAGLTTPLTQGGVTQISNGPAVDSLIYFGSTAAGTKLQAATDPGVDPVTLEALDSAPATGIAATALRFALSAAGLDSATPGAALVLGTTLLSGAVNAVPVFVRTDSGIATPGTYADLALRVADVVETAQ